MSEIERASTEKEKTGVFTGASALHPLTREPIPIWVADFVLGTYGTGAIQGVPAHDQRDWEFARAIGLPIVKVIEPDDPAAADPDMAYTGHGTVVNSGPYSGMRSEQMLHDVIAELAHAGQGHKSVNYRLRDWLVSRQRYWGAPIPIVHCARCGEVPVPEEHLPVELPYDVDFSLGAGKSPLERSASFMQVACPRCGEPANRDADTMDTFVDSSWYYFRYLSPARLDDVPWDRALVDRWLPVYQYSGGIEHAVLHLLYSRFVTKAMRDLGHVEHRRAVPAPVPPGHDHERGRQDVEVARQRDQPRRVRGAVRSRRVPRLPHVRLLMGRRRRLEGRGDSRDLRMAPARVAARRSPPGAVRGRPRPPRGRIPPRRPRRSCSGYATVR